MCWLLCYSTTSSPNFERFCYSRKGFWYLTTSTLCCANNGEWYIYCDNLLNAGAERLDLTWLSALGRISVRPWWSRLTIVLPEWLAFGEDFYDDAAGFVQAITYWVESSYTTVNKSVHATTRYDTSLLYQLLFIDRLRCGVRNIRGSGYVSQNWTSNLSRLHWLWREDLSLYKIVITIACTHFPYIYLKTYKLSLILIISQFDTFWDIKSVNMGISMSSEVFGLVHIFIIW